MSGNNVVERPRTADEVLTWSRTLVEPALRAAVDSLPGPLRRICGYHFGWWDERGQATAADPGKAIRPALTLLTARAVGGSAEAAVPVAVAVELVHNFSLLHDDVMDADLTRRHRPTAWSVFGISQAILAGDALLAVANRMLAQEPAPVCDTGAEWIGTCCVELCAGQWSDMDFEQRADVSVSEVLAMAAGKTGALLGCACALGALAGGVAPAAAGRLDAFGRKLGLAFQYVDDLLGIWGDPEVTGKPVFADLERGKKSLPVVAALISGTAAGARLAALYHANRPRSEAELRFLAELIEAAGARTWACGQAAAALSDAVGIWQAEVADSVPAAELLQVAYLIARRDG